jgi:peptidoglycan-associated lipoprotein
MSMRFPALAAATVATVLLGACSTAPKVAPVAEAPAAVQPTPAAPAATTKQVATAPARPQYLDPASDIARRRVVHFGFDDSTLRPEDRDIAEIQGRYLAAHPEVSVRVEGNTDERGSEEYNLALGQRRASALEQALRVFGARDSQMEAVSWGEEKPVAQGHDEAAWSQNRRAEVVYPAR